MNQTAAFSTTTIRTGRPKAVLIAGLIAGTLDMLGALITYGLIVAHVKPGRILRGIASGIFGKAAINGGWQMEIFGLLFHYCIALIFATFYFLIYPFFPLLKKHKIICGLVYGACVWAVMNLVVLPLSHASPSTLTIKSSLIGMLLIMLFIGLPVSLLANRFYANKKINAV